MTTEDQDTGEAKHKGNSQLDERSLSQVPRPPFIHLESSALGTGKMKMNYSACFYKEFTISWGRSDKYRDPWNTTHAVEKGCQSAAHRVLRGMEQTHSKKARGLWKGRWH